MRAVVVWGRSSGDRGRRDVDEAGGGLPQEAHVLAASGRIRRRRSGLLIRLRQRGMGALPTCTRAPHSARRWEHYKAVNESCAACSKRRRCGFAAHLIGLSLRVLPAIKRERPMPGPAFGYPWPMPRLRHARGSTNSRRHLAPPHRFPRSTTQQCLATPTRLEERLEWEQFSVPAVSAHARQAISNQGGAEFVPNSTDGEPARTSCASSGSPASLGVGVRADRYTKA